MTNPFEGTSRLKKCVAAAAFNFQMKLVSMLTSFIHLVMCQLTYDF